MLGHLRSSASSRRPATCAGSALSVDVRRGTPVTSSIRAGPRGALVRGRSRWGTPATATVDVYATDVEDASLYGEGRAYVGSATPDALGDWTLVVAGFPAYALLSATATDARAAGGRDTPIAGQCIDGEIDAAAAATATSISILTIRCDAPVEDNAVRRDDDEATAAAARTDATPAAATTARLVGGHHIPVDAI